MTLTYQLDQNDFLQHQLFAATKNERVKKQRTRSWIIVTGAVFLLSYLFYQSINPFLFYYFIILGVITLIFYPVYLRRHYIKYYNSYISDNFKNRIGQTINVRFTADTIETYEVTGETKINLSELENVTETPDYFFPALKAGGHLIIPKSKIGDVSQLRTELKQLCEQRGIDFVEDLKWKWK